MIAMRRVRTGQHGGLLGVLYDDAFDDIRDIFALIGGIFGRFLNFFPLDDFQHSLGAGKKFTEGFFEDGVPFVFQAVHLNAEIQRPAAVLESAQGLLTALPIATWPAQHFCHSGRGPAKIYQYGKAACGPSSLE